MFMGWRAHQKLQSPERPVTRDQVRTQTSWQMTVGRLRLRDPSGVLSNLDSTDGIKRGWGSAELTEKPWLWLSLPNVDYVFPPLGRIGALDLLCLRWQMATAFDSGKTEYFHHPESSMGQNCSRYKLSYRKIKYIPGTPSLIDWHCYLLYI